MRTCTVPIVALMLGVCVLNQACDNAAWAKTCQDLRLCDPEPLPAEAIDVLCDATPGSPCNKDTMQATLDAVLPYAAARPGSGVRLYGLEATFDKTALLESHTSPAMKSTGPGAREREQDRWIREARSVFMKDIEGYVEPRPNRHLSPLAEALTKVAQAHVPNDAPWWIVVVTDARQVSGVNFECKHSFPTEDEWLRYLDEHGVLPPGSLNGAYVIFSFVEHGEVINRTCKAVDRSPKRASDIRHPVACRLRSRSRHRTYSGDWKEAQGVRAAC